MADISQCRSCGAFIYWLKQVKRQIDPVGKVITVEVPGAKANPIDVQSHADGNLVIDRDGGRYRFATIDEIDTAKWHGKKLYISHFSTCPNAKEHRNR